MKVVFRKQSDGISCELRDVKFEQFQLENGFYCYVDEVSDDEFAISFRLKMAEDKFMIKSKFCPKKHYLQWEKTKDGYHIIFTVPKGKYSVVNSTGQRFCFYQNHQVPHMQYSFKLWEVKEGAFDYTLPKPKIKESELKKKKSTPEERRVKRQKWSLEHPLQGGGFSPR